MDEIKSFFMYSIEGAPVWGWFAGAFILHLEYFLPRTKKIKANSTLEAIPNLLAGLAGRFWPPVGIVLQRLGTPAPETPPKKTRKTKKSGETK